MGHGPFVVRRQAALVQDRAARQFKRQAQAEPDSRPDFPGAFEDGVRRQIIEPSQLIIIAKFAPVRSCRTPFPSLSHNKTSHLIKYGFPRWENTRHERAASRNFRGRIDYLPTRASLYGLRTGACASRSAERRVGQELVSTGR